MRKFLRGGVLALTAAVLVTVGFTTSVAQSATTTFSVIADSGSCDNCPTLTATVAVDPATGGWTLSLTSGNPAIPQPVTTASATEQTSVTQSNPPAGGHTGNGPTNPATSFVSTSMAAGQMSGTSSAIVTGETSDQADSSQSTSDSLQDTDTTTTIIVTVTLPCPAGGSVCTYHIKFKATSNEGFSVSQAP